MPSFSLPTSRMRRGLAACAISMSDFGFWRCEAGMFAGSAQAYEEWKTTGRTGLSSRKPRFDSDVGGLGPFAGIDLLAVGGLNARDLESAIGADNRDAIG